MEQLRAKSSEILVMHYRRCHSGAVRSEESAVTQTDCGFRTAKAVRNDRITQWSTRPPAIWVS